MPTDNVFGADNQQETLCLFYYTGFCCGEISCSLLRLSNRKSKIGGVYYTPDITISNADRTLLEECNQIIADGCGNISRIKGGYNLSVRGKIKVKKILNFFKNYPPIVGDLVLSRLFLINKAIEVLESRKSYRRSNSEQKQLERIRKQFIEIKATANPISKYSQKVINQDAIGYFLSGILDAEGSVGLKSNGSSKQPFLAVAMKDRKIVELFRDFLKIGHIHYRPKEKIHHFEIGAKREVLFALQLFSDKYPSKLEKVKKRIHKLQRILNDYTPEPKLIGI